MWVTTPARAAALLGALLVAALSLPTHASGEGAGPAPSTGIPRELHVAPVHESDPSQSGGGDALATWRALGVEDWAVRVWDAASERTDLIRASYPELLSPFEAMEDPAERASLFALLVVHQHGGAYADADVMFHRSLDDVVEVGDSLVVGLAKGEERQMHPGVFAAAKGHPALLRAAYALARCALGVEPTAEEGVGCPGASTALDKRVGQAATALTTAVEAASPEEEATWGKPHIMPAKVLGDTGKAPDGAVAMHDPREGFSSLAQRRQHVSLVQRRQLLDIGSPIPADDQLMHRRQLLSQINNNTLGPSGQDTNYPQNFVCTFTCTPGTQDCPCGTYECRTTEDKLYYLHVTTQCSKLIINTYCSNKLDPYCNQEFNQGIRQHESKKIGVAGGEIKIQSLNVRVEFPVNAIGSETLAAVGALTVNDIEYVPGANNASTYIFVNADDAAVTGEYKIHIPFSQLAGHTPTLFFSGDHGMTWEQADENSPDINATTQTAFGSSEMEIKAKKPGVFVVMNVDDSQAGAPPNTCETVEIKFLFDNYPTESTIELWYGSATVVWSYQGAYTDRAQERTWTMTLCEHEQQHMLLVKDSVGDGVCCDYGVGGYRLTHNGQVKAGSSDLTSAGAFGSRRSTYFRLRPLPSPPPSPPPARPPPPAPNPPPPTCSIIRVEIRTDRYPSEAGFRLSTSLGTVLEDLPAGSFTQASSLHTKTYSVCAAVQSMVVTALFTDTVSDGWCCGYGRGGYAVYQNEQKIVGRLDTGDFGASIEVPIQWSLSAGSAGGPPGQSPPPAPSPPAPAPPFVGNAEDAPNWLANTPKAPRVFEAAGCTSLPVEISLDKPANVYYYVEPLTTAAGAAVMPTSFQVKETGNGGGSGPPQYGVHYFPNPSTTESFDITFCGVSYDDAVTLYMVAEDFNLNLQAQPVAISVSALATYTQYPAFDFVIAGADATDPALALSEGGLPRSYTVAVSEEPRSFPITYRVKASAENQLMFRTRDDPQWAYELLVSRSSADYSQPFTVQVMAVNDNYVEGFHSVMIDHIYDGQSFADSGQSLKADIEDNDEPQLIAVLNGAEYNVSSLTNIPVNVMEGGAVQVEFKLGAASLQPVSVFLDTDDAYLDRLSSVGPDDSFMQNGTVQAGALYALQNTFAEGTVAATARISVSSANNMYNCQPVSPYDICGSFNVSIEDDDVPGIWYVNQQEMTRVALAEEAEANAGLNRRLLAVTATTPNSALPYVINAEESLTCGEIGSPAGPSWFGIVLNSQPLNDVTVRLRPYLGSQMQMNQITFTPSSVVFTSTDWSDARNISVEGIADGRAEGDLQYAVKPQATSQDAAYNDLAPTNVKLNLTVVDSSSAEIRPSDTEFTVEEGLYYEYALDITSKPTKPVTVSPFISEVVAIDALAMSDVTTHQALIMEAAQEALDFVVPNVTFPANELGVFIVRVATKASPRATGDVVLKVSHSIQTNDTVYAAITIPPVEVTLVDTQEAGLIFDPPDALETREGDPATGFNVSLATIPFGNVTLTMSSVDGQVTLAGSQVVFTRQNWNVPQYVEVATIDDAVEEGYHDAAIDVVLSSDIDLFYNNITEEYFVEIEDNDFGEASATVSANSGGSLQLNSGGGVAFPAGSLQGNTPVQVKELDSANISAKPSEDKMKPKTTITKFDAGGATFSKPVTIKAKLPKKASKNTGSLQFVRATNDTLGDWTVRPGVNFTADSSGQKTASVQTTSFSLWTVADIQPTVQAATCLSLPCNTALQSYTENSGWQVVGGNIELIRRSSAVPAGNLLRAKVTLSPYYANEDVLAAIDGTSLLADPTNCTSDGGTITACWNYASGELSIVSSTEVSATVMQAKLKTLAFYNNNDQPRDATRRIKVKLEEPYASSQRQLSGGVKVIRVNDPPQVTPSTTPMTYLEKDPPKQLDSDITISDLDSTIFSAKVYVDQINANDKLSYDLNIFQPVANRITVVTSDNPTAGTKGFALTGAARPQDYQIALRSFKFANDGPRVKNLLHNITFEVTDAEGQTANATRVLSITPVNEPPTVSQVAIQVNAVEDQVGGASGTMVAADPDSDLLTYYLVCQPTQGTVNVTDKNLGTFTYTPNKNAFGADGFTYKVYDDFMLNSTSMGMVNINIDSRPDPPVAANMTIYVYACTNNSRTLLGCVDGVDFEFEGSDPDGDDDIATYYIEVEPVYDLNNLKLEDEVVTGTLRSGGPTFKYVADEGTQAALARIDKFTYYAMDKTNQRSNSAVVTVVIEQYGTGNLAPAQSNDMFLNLTEGSSITFALNGTGMLSGLYYEVIEGPFHGTLTEATTNPPGFNPLNPDLKVTYTPYDKNWHGTDYFLYEIRHSVLEYSNISRVDILVESVNDPPLLTCLSDASAYSSLTPDEIQTMNEDTDIVKNSITNLVTLEGYQNTTEENRWRYMSDNSAFLCDEEYTTLRALPSRGTDIEGRYQYINQPEGFQMYLYVWDVDVLYADGNPYSFRWGVSKMPTFGRLLWFYEQDSGEFTEAQSDLELVNTNEDNTLMVVYQPDNERAGTDSFTWFAVDEGGLQSPAGTVNIKVSCAPGYEVDMTDQSFCIPCPAGEINIPGALNQKECVPCPVGHYSELVAGTECTACLEGSYATSKGTASCTSCPDSTMTTKPLTSATSVDSCKCLPGTFYEWEQGSWSTLECVTCDRPDLTKCEDYHQVIPVPKRQGVWVDPTDGRNVLECYPPEACIFFNDTVSTLSGNCSTGYMLDGCTQCVDGYYRNLRNGYAYCDKCPPTPDWVYAVLAAALIILLPILLKLSRVDAGFGALNIALAYVQVISVFRELEVDWPDSVVDFFQMMAAFNFDIFTFSPPECMVSGVTFLDKFWMINILPLIFAGLFLIVTGIKMLHYRIIKHTREPVFACLWPRLKGMATFDTSDLEDLDPEIRSEQLVLRENESVQAARTKAVLMIKGSPKDENGNREHQPLPGVLRRWWYTRGYKFGFSTKTWYEQRIGLVRILSGFFLFLQWGYFLLCENSFSYFDCITTGEGSRRTLVLRGDTSIECYEGEHWDLLPMAIIFLLMYPIGIVVLFGTLMYRKRFALRTKGAETSNVVMAALMWREFSANAPAPKKEEKRGGCFSCFKRVPSKTKISDGDEGASTAGTERGTSPEEIAKRLAHATSAISAKEYDYDHKIVDKWGKLSLAVAEKSGIGTYKTDAARIKHKDLKQEYKFCYAMFGFLFKRYEAPWFWWEICVLLRKALFSAVATIMKQPLEQLLVMLISIIMFTNFFLHARPYDSTLLDVMECFVLLSSILILGVGFLFWSNLLNEEESKWCEVVLLTGMSLSLVTVAIFVLLDSTKAATIVYRTLRKELLDWWAYRGMKQEEKAERIARSKHRFQVINNLLLKNIREDPRRKKYRRVMESAKVIFKRDTVEELEDIFDEVFDQTNTPGETRHAEQRAIRAENMINVLHKAYLSAVIARSVGGAIEQTWLEDSKAHTQVSDKAIARYDDHIQEDSLFTILEWLSFHASERHKLMWLEFLAVLKEREFHPLPELTKDVVLPQKPAEKEEVVPFSSTEGSSSDVQTVVEPADTGEDSESQAVV